MHTCMGHTYVYPLLNMFCIKFEYDTFHTIEANHVRDFQWSARPVYECTLFFILFLSFIFGCFHVYFGWWFYCFCFWVTVVCSSYETALLTTTTGRKIYIYSLFKRQLMKKMFVADWLTMLATKIYISVAILYVHIFWAAYYFYSKTALVESRGRPHPTGMRSSPVELGVFLICCFQWWIFQNWVRLSSQEALVP